MLPNQENAGNLIATILRHDKKVASYKIALIRSINDVVLGFPHLGLNTKAIAVPLKTLARFWIAYYWPFVDLVNPVQQAQKSAGKEDLSFRPILTRLRREWESTIGISSGAADGYFLVGEFLSATRRKSYPNRLWAIFSESVLSIAKAIQQPIRYAGPGQYSVFQQPVRWRKIEAQTSEAVCLPETQPDDICVVINAELWKSFCKLSLWIEALCIHEWCLFTENLTGIDRGIIYVLLTDRPANRRPFTWERNQVEILMMEGLQFSCPWTGKKLSTTSYDIDHLLPISVYPVNELWNLVPADPQFNQYVKRDRIPSIQRLTSAAPRIQNTYENYLRSPQLAAALAQDTYVRFGVGKSMQPVFAAMLTHAVTNYLEIVLASRNLRAF